MKIATSFELPELANLNEVTAAIGPISADVVIDRGGVESLQERGPAAAQGDVCEADFGPETVALHYSDGISFSVDYGAPSARIEVFDPSGNSRSVRSYLLGPVLGLLQVLKGRSVLHTGAVVIDGGAVAIVGPSMAGKSTLTLALGAAGHEVLADDVLVLDKSDGVWRGIPGYPRIRFRSKLNRTRRHIAPGSKSYSFRESPAPLRTIYILEPPSQDPHIEDLYGSDAQLALTPHYFGADLPSPRLHIQATSWLADIVTHVPVRMFRPRIDDPDGSGLLLIADQARRFRRQA